MSQEEVLKVIQENKILTIKELMKLTELSWSTVGHNLSKLEKNGEIIKIYVPGKIVVYCSIEMREDLWQSK